MIRSVALGLTLLTGFSGLVYEVVWQRYLAILLGSHGEATAAVLGIFLGGLSVGYRLFGTATRRMLERAAAAGRPPRLLALYGAVEAAIGLYALIFPELFSALSELSLALPQASRGINFAFDIGLTVLLIGPPTVLMGGTIPVLTQALARSLTDATRIHAFVYAFNTAGAFFGALAAGFWLVPALGLAGVVRTMALVNLVAGAVFLGVGLLRTDAAAAPAPEPSEGERRVPAFASYAAVALLAGFAMMAIQTLLNRLGALALGSSQFTFAMVVASFVLCIALGSFAVSALPRVRSLHLVGSQWLLVALLLLAYGPLENVAWYGHQLRIPFRSDPIAFLPYQGAVFVGLLVALVIPVGLSGALLPLLFHHLRRHAEDLGEVAGRLYAWNTVGSLLGALLGGYLLLFWLDLHAVFRIAVAALAIGTGVLTLRVYPRARVLAAVAVVGSLGSLALREPWDPARLAAGMFRSNAPEVRSSMSTDDALAYRKQVERVIFHKDGPSTSATVVEVIRTGDRGLRSNGKPEGSTLADYQTMTMVALVPSLLAEDCATSFVVGWGTGVTVGELAALDCSREIVVAEISQGVLEAAPLFDAWTKGVSSSPKVETVRGDAYRILLRDPRRFDVIVSEPSNPWVMGVENLYSREFLSAARDRLTPGGVYAQWFHAYEMDAATLAIVLRTYAEVFPHVSVWSMQPNDLLLLGLLRSDEALDLPQLVARAGLPDFRAGLERAGIANVSALLAHEMLPLGVVHAARLRGPAHTLLDPILADHAARAFFLGGRAQLPDLHTLAAVETAQRNALLPRFVASSPEPTDALRSAALEICHDRRRQCVALLGAWRQRDPSAGDGLDFRAWTPAGDRIERVPPALIQSVAEFFDEDTTDLARLAPEQAAGRGRLWSAQFHPGYPFSMASYETLWERCEAPAEDAFACARARAEAEGRVGRRPRTR